MHYGGDTVRISLNVNNTDRYLDINPGDMLYDALKALGVTSVKKSCGTGFCGACTVLLDGKPIPSCSYFAVKADGHSITTVEGVASEAERFGGFMAEEGAIQCGYCNPGFVLTVISMKRNGKCHSDEEIKNYLTGNLCRCSGYQGQLRAIKKYLEVSE